MMKKIIFRYLLFLLFFLIFSISSDIISEQMRKLIGQTYKYISLFIFTQTLILLIFGLLLGGAIFTREQVKAGSWKLNKYKLTIFGLPAFLIILMFNLPYLGVQIPQTLYQLILPSAGVTRVALK